MYFLSRAYRKIYKRRNVVRSPTFAENQKMKKNQLLKLDSSVAPVYEDYRKYRNNLSNGIKKYKQQYYCTVLLLYNTIVILYNTIVIQYYNLLVLGIRTIERRDYWAQGLWSTGTVERRIV